MWDERYSESGYWFGTEPAAFLAAQRDVLEPGRSALVVADGEGRNSVFLAEQGLIVTAMDASPVGVEKARRFAAERNLSVDYHVADILEWDWDAASYDLVVGIFFQFLIPDDRTQVFDGLARAIAPGGRLLLHGYRPEQVDYATGGPRTVRTCTPKSCYATRSATSTSSGSRATTPRSRRERVTSVVPR